MEPHPEDWCETLHPAIDMLKTIGSDKVKFLYCAPHTFYFGDHMRQMIRDAGPLINHVHVADTYNHKALRVCATSVSHSVSTGMRPELPVGEAALRRSSVARLAISSSQAICR